VSKNKAKLAGTIANPADNPELFDEGWDAALEKEQSRGEHVVEAEVVDGDPADAEKQDEQEETAEEEEDA
jgi:coatomer subunit beta'